MLALVDVLAWVVGVCVAVLAVLVAYVRSANRPSLPAGWSAGLRLDGKTVLITTTGTGVGLVVARMMVDEGARVILACSDKVKVNNAAGEVGEGGREAVVSWRHLDTASLASVNAFADHVITTKQKVDVVVAAASVGGAGSRQLTEEGLEHTMAANHFGHFLLLNRLMGVLRDAGGRVVVMAPSAHLLLAKINSKDLNFNRVPYSGVRAFAQSCLSNVLMTTCMAHLTAGTGVTVNAWCPGLVGSVPYLAGDGVLPWLYRLALTAVARGDEEAGVTAVYLAGSEQVMDVSGGFFIDCAETRLGGLAGDLGLAKKVWEVSEGLVGLAPTD